MPHLRTISLSTFLFFLQTTTWANPYWNPQQVPTDNQFVSYQARLPDVANLRSVAKQSGIDVLRIQVDWSSKGERYTVAEMMMEASGTEALLARSTHRPQWGSYLGILVDEASGKPVYYDAVGTGKEYRKLTRAVSFRFPKPMQTMIFELYAENPQTGVMEKVLSQPVGSMTLTKQPVISEVEVKELALAKNYPAVRVNIYADGYTKSEQKTFWQHAMKTVQALQTEKFPGVDSMSFYGVFHASNAALGAPRDLGQPIPNYDSFLGLFYPYWDKFGRWYNIVYPTRENKLRRGFATAPYDYPIVLVNSDEYWGVGNYMAFTAIPAASSSYFTYLLLHEFGHFFGLNEEYQGGGPTELEFAPGIAEPWSQNITFLTDTSYTNLKWNKFVDSKTPLPTPDSVWRSSPPIYGAYLGGYADSRSTVGSSHKPGLNCVMESASHFCHICAQAINDVVNYSLGEN